MPAPIVQQVQLEQSLAKQVPGLVKVVRDLSSAVQGAFLALFLARPLVDGVLLKDVKVFPLASAPRGTKVAHQLGREPVGWVVVRKNDEADLWETQAENTQPTTQLLLSSSAPVTVTLWVF